MFIPMNIWIAVKDLMKLYYPIKTSLPDKLLLADVFENFRDKCIEIYELDSAHFCSTLG